jgi:hypothetical protein
LNHPPYPVPIRLIPVRTSARVAKAAGTKEVTGRLPVLGVSGDGTAAYHGLKVMIGDRVQTGPWPSAEVEHFTGDRPEKLRRLKSEEMYQENVV